MISNINQLEFYSSNITISLNPIDEVHPYLSDREVTLLNEDKALLFVATVVEKVTRDLLITAFPDGTKWPYHFNNLNQLSLFLDTIKKSEQLTLDEGETEEALKLRKDNKFLIGIMKHLLPCQVLARLAFLGIDTVEKTRIATDCDRFLFFSTTNQDGIRPSFIHACQTLSKTVGGRKMNKLSSQSFEEGEHLLKRWLFHAQKTGHYDSVDDAATSLQLFAVVKEAYLAFLTPSLSGRS